MNDRNWRRNVPQEYRISIITVNYNGMKDTCALLDCFTFGERDLEVIVVDNGSKNNEAELISSRYPHAKVIRSNKNLGFAGGNNLGIKESRGRCLLLINNDTEVNVQDIYLLADRLEKSEKIGMACPKIKFFFGERRIQFAGFTPLSHITFRNKGIGFGEADYGQYDTPHPTPYAHGAAMMVKRDAIEKVGLMPECYFLYYEELDWSLMFRRGGYEIWYEPASTVYHKESQTTGEESPLKTYYLTRNRLLFIKRNSNEYRFLSYIYVIFVVALRDIGKHLLRKKTNLAKATIKGIVDFIKY